MDHDDVDPRSGSDYETGQSSDDGEGPVEMGALPDVISTFSLRNATSETPERIRVAEFPNPCAPVERPHTPFQAPPPSQLPASLAELADPVVLKEVEEWPERDFEASQVSLRARLRLPPAQVSFSIDDY